MLGEDHDGDKDVVSPWQTHGEIELAIGESAQIPNVSFLVQQHGVRLRATYIPQNILDKLDPIPPTHIHML